MICDDFNMGTTQLTEKQRENVKCLFEAGIAKRAIARHTGFSIRQVRYTLQQPTTTPGFARRGVKQKMTMEEQAQLVEFITNSKHGRQMRWADLAATLFEGRFTEWTISHTLRRLKYRRRVARRKPPISEETRLARLRFAEEHKDWTFQQWASILWSDETYISHGLRFSQYVTRRDGEAMEPTCIDDTRVRCQGQMLWGCFNGEEKGPEVLWHKPDYGNMTAEGYRDRIVPLIRGWIRKWKRDTGEDLVFMQDNAPIHTAKIVIKDLEESGVVVIFWPPYSPDLNPIEHVWAWVKNWINEKWPQARNGGYLLMEQIEEAWRAVPASLLRKLLESMPERCRQVIEANGLHTKY
jgi:transposase